MRCKCKRCRRPCYKIVVIRERSKNSEVKLKPPHLIDSPHISDYEQMCPNCGEIYSTKYYVKQGQLSKGVLSAMEVTRPKGFLGLSSQTYQCYYCLTCDHRWELPK